MRKPSEIEIDDAHALFTEMALVGELPETYKVVYKTIRMCLEWIKGDKKGEFVEIQELAKKQRRIRLFGPKNVEAWDKINGKKEI